jgi:hypothetical protein
VTKFFFEEVTGRSELPIGKMVRQNNKKISDGNDPDGNISDLEKAVGSSRYA